MVVGRVGVGVGQGDVQVGVAAQGGHDDLHLDERHGHVDLEVLVLPHVHHLAARRAALEHDRAVAARRAQRVRGAGAGGGDDGDEVVAVCAEELVVVPDEQPRAATTRAPLVRQRARHGARPHVHAHAAVGGGEQDREVGVCARDARLVVARHPGGLDQRRLRQTVDQADRDRQGPRRHHRVRGRGHGMHADVVRAGGGPGRAH
mmetsp:Transcript_10903/g.25957  ORF Transcript_10903/g.25957 Transcript_10903/m.25957 type:complete len:204 (-) Transcript_10903:717-1328(-)